jgi:hypothetical protein
MVGENTTVLLGQTSPPVRHHKHGIYGNIFLPPNMIQCLQPLDLVICGLVKLVVFDLKQDRG